MQCWSATEALSSLAACAKKRVPIDGEEENPPCPNLEARHDLQNVAPMLTIRVISLNATPIVWMALPFELLPLVLHRLTLSWIESLV